MPKFKVVVHGTGFTVRRFLFLRRRLGFYTTCFVEALSGEEAAEQALSVVRDDPKLVLASETVPRLTAEEVSEIPSFEGCRLPRTGAAFYRA